MALHDAKDMFSPWQVSWEGNPLVTSGFLSQKANKVEPLGTVHRGMGWLRMFPYGDRNNMEQLERLTPSVKSGFWFLIWHFIQKYKLFNLHLLITTKNKWQPLRWWLKLHVNITLKSQVISDSVTQWFCVYNCVQHPSRSWFILFKTVVGMFFTTKKPWYMCKVFTPKALLLYRQIIYPNWRSSFRSWCR